MKRIILAGVASAAILSAHSASAADLPYRGGARAPAPIQVIETPRHRWQGAYAGVNAGYGVGKFDGTGAGIFGKASGGQIGGTLGYNHQMGNVVIGVEGDLDYNNAKNSRFVPPRGGLPGGIATSSASTSSLLTARGRLGYAVDRALVYGTAGYAGGNVKTAVVDTSIAGPYSSSDSSWRNGYAVGGGIEYAFTHNVSAKAEYLYTDLAKQNVLAAPWSSNTGVHESTVRGGVNYHF